MGAATALLGWCAYGGLHGEVPLPFAAICVLQAINNVGSNGFRALVGLHAAVIAKDSGIVGMANGWMEIVGQVGSVLGGQPLGALAAHFATAAVAGTQSQADPDASSGWVIVLAIVTLVQLALTLMHVLLLPQE